MSSGARSEVQGEEVFHQVATASGFHFIHFNGMSGELYLPEMTGQGGALFDYDGDGDLDVHLVQGTMLGPGKTVDDAVFPLAGFPGDRLFRNDLFWDGGRQVLRFVDVTERSGLGGATGYGMGVATGDYDNDGWLDLYVTNYGPNQLWRNRRDGTFEDVTEVSGTGDPLWGASATFLDADGDGRLDLYVVNYVEFDLERNPACYAASSRRDYCGPSAFPPQPDRLFRNRGDGKFEDVTHRALRGYAPGPGLGVAAADLNGDGLVDLYVANDGEPNQLWINRGGGVFSEEALFAGAALNREGRPEASMGVAVGDFDADGDEDLLLTHLMGETNTLYVNDGTGLFEDRSVESGLGAASLPYTAFGTVWLDFDNDGWLDLVTLNGAVRILEEPAATGDPFPLKQPNQLFRNLGGRFEEVSAGEAFARPEVSRGAAVGDIDRDGDIDLLVLNNSGSARLLANFVGQDRHWLGVDSLGPAGARIGVELADGSRVWRRSHTDGSYCSASAPGVVVGLGSADRVAALTVRWPGGGQRRYLDPPVERHLVVPSPPHREGSSP